MTDLAWERAEKLCTHEKCEKTPADGTRVNVLCLICGAENRPSLGGIWQNGVSSDKWPVYPHLIERYWPQLEKK